MVKRILVLAFILTSYLSNACSCFFYTDFCETAHMFSNIASVKIISTYYGWESDHYIDVEVVEVLAGYAQPDLITFRTGQGTSCDPSPSDFIVGDTIFVNIVQDFGDPNWNGFTLSSPCSQLFLIPSEESEGVSYAQFVEDFDECVEEGIDFFFGTLEENTLIFPNPTTTDLQIQSIASVEMVIKIYASNGSLVASFDFEKYLEEPLDVSDWPKGLYFVRFETPDVSFVKKFVKS